MKAKRGAKFERLRVETWFLLGFVDAVFRAVTGKPAVVTSARDSHEHKRSLHNSGEGIDFRTRHVTKQQARAVYTFLRKWLDPLGFDTVLEPDHIHVEWDPKKGQIFIISGVAT